MVGKLQSKKQKMLLKSSYIHSLDSQKLADIFNVRVKIQKLKYFIQVNIGNEIQKSAYQFLKLSFIIIVLKKIN